MDPITSAIVKKGVSELSETAKEGGKSFLKAVLQPPGEALGGIYADKLNERRHANLIGIAARANERLKTAGVSAKQVPLSIIHPALEAASLEEDPGLQDVWANLFANTADSRPTAKKALPSFSRILRDLTTSDVRLLDALYPESMPHKLEDDPETLVERVIVSIEDLLGCYIKAGLAHNSWTDVPSKAWTGPEFREDRQSLMLSMDTLIQHGLFRVTGSQFTINAGPVDSPHYSRTYLGNEFVLACRPPKQ